MSDHEFKEGDVLRVIKTDEYFKILLLGEYETTLRNEKTGELVSLSSGEEIFNYFISRGREELQ